jgi:hypothetical protein
MAHRVWLSGLYSARNSLTITALQLHQTVASAAVLGYIS